MKSGRFLFFVFVIACHLLTFPATALSDSGYKFVSKWGSGSLGDGILKYPMAVAIDASGNVYVADSGNKRIQKFSSSGNFITKWGSEGKGDGQFKSVYDIAIDASGNVYVTDEGNNRIEKFDSTGQFITKWGSEGKGDGQFNSPRGIAVDALGNIYVADYNNSRIQKFTSSGIFITKWGSRGIGDGQFQNPFCVAVDVSGNVYVLAFSDVCMQKFDSKGNFITKWGSRGSGDGQFMNPRGMAVDASGNVYVTNSGLDSEGPNIQKYSSSGSFIAKWNSQNTGIVNLHPYGIDIDASGNVYITDVGNFCIQKLSPNGVFITGWGSSAVDGQFWYPGGVAVDASGNVYVVDSSNHRIQKFTSSGTFITKWGSEGSGDGQFNYPRSIAIDFSGNVYVTDPMNNRIQKFTSSGTFITKWSSDGSGDGQFYRPAGIAVDASGNVYVTDPNNHRIQKFTSSGTFITKWGSEGSGDGQLNYPFAIAVDSSGNVYVSDEDSESQIGRIQRFSSSGVFIAKWGSFSEIGGIGVDVSGDVYISNVAFHQIQKFSSSGSFITKWGSEGSGDGKFDTPSSIAVDSTGNVYVADYENWNVQKFAPVSSGGANTNLYFPHVAATDPWQTEIALINTGDRTLNGVLRAYKSNGKHLSDIDDVTLPAHGRRQIDVATEFADHAGIGYMIFETRFPVFQGYAKFYKKGIYRAAIPAVKEMNSTSQIHIPHIASNAQWRTEVVLLNTTPEKKELVIIFNNLQIKNITLNANEHKIFDIADLFDNQPQPEIGSAVISNTDGIIGAEIFGSTDGNQLDGILLTDKTVWTLYYPHVAGVNWWTGIAVYNPSGPSCKINITPYDVQGTALASSALSITDRGKYVGTISQLGFPSETAWFRIDSSRPLTGFALFSQADNRQLAAYAGGIGAGARKGVFPKIEKDGWTGIAFVNMEATAANVLLIAYDDNGDRVDSRVFMVQGHAKVAGPVEDLFLDDISNATYIAYSSDRDIVGFQLNASADGTMLDGLPVLGGTN